MRQLLIALTTAAVLALPCAATAQTKDKPGQSEYAPGHQPGPAKRSAPGQREQRYDKDKQPGAKEYAPGQQPHR
jgi:hypothetical protein